MIRITTMTRVIAQPALMCVALLLVLGGCESPPPAPSPQGVRDTSSDFMPPGSSLQGARRRVITVVPASLLRSGGYSGNFELTNRGSQTVILASVITASEHVTASSPGAMPFRVDPGKRFSVTVTVKVPWDRALTDGGIARVLTTDGETINLWLQLVSDEPVAPVSGAVGLRTEPGAGPSDTSGAALGGNFCVRTSDEPVPARS